MAQVQFLSSVGGDNSIVSDDDNPTTGLDSDGHRTRLIPAFANIVAIASNVVTKASQVVTNAALAAASALAAANSAASVAGISVGDELLSAPHNASLGSSAFVDLNALPLCVYPIVLSGAYTVVATDHGKALLSNAYNITLPDAARCDIPFAFQLKNTHGSTSITVTRAGADTIDGGTSITLTAGTSKLIIKSASGAFVSL